LKGGDLFFNRRCFNSYTLA